MASLDEPVSQALISLASNLDNSSKRANLSYFSLSQSDKQHKGNTVQHDVIQFVRRINREFSESSDKVKCSIALNFSIGSANYLLEELIELHQSCWDKVATEFKILCKKPFDTKQLQRDILNLEIFPGESIHQFYERSARLIVKLVSQKPHRQDWANEEASDGFSRSISAKFRRSLTETDLTSLKTVFGKALKFIEARPKLHHLHEPQVVPRVDPSYMKNAKAALTTAAVSTASRIKSHEEIRQMHNQRMRSKVPQLREDIPLLTPYCENCFKEHPTRYCPCVNQSHPSELSRQQSSVIVKQSMDFSRVSDIKAPEITPHQQPVDTLNSHLVNELDTKQSSLSCHTSNYRSNRYPPSQLNLKMRGHFRNRFSASIPYIGAFRAC